MDEDKEFEHESYGLVGFSRVSGAGRLFGSPLERHHSTIRLRVRRARRIHSHGFDRFSGVGLPAITEIELSAAQFAELLTTMNVGDGVPCTIRAVGTEPMQEPPDDHENEAAEVRHGFDSKAEAIAQMVQGLSSEVDGLLETAKASGKTRDAVRARIGRVVTEVGLNLPFVLRQFQDAVVRTTTSARAEVDAFLTHAVQAAGLQHLRAGAAPPPALPIHDVAIEEP